MKLDRNMADDMVTVDILPDWVPEPAHNYLAHVTKGASLRAVAKARGTHASTVLRHVRQLENRRDDPLIDEALDGLARQLDRTQKTNHKEPQPMSLNSPRHAPVEDIVLHREALRILRRLTETTAVLIIGQNLEKAVVLRENKAGDAIRIGVLDRRVAQAFALKDWIECFRPGKIAHYRITNAGRAALKRMLADQARQETANGFAEDLDPFKEQHSEWETREFTQGDGGRKRLKVNLAESPLTALGRRAGKNGKPFLSNELILAGERLREDFEVAQMGPRVTQNWDRFLTMGRGGDFDGAGPAEGPRAARERVAVALKDLGPGLGDIVLRCCCYLEGLEAAEKRMGWSARSGKIVLRIALHRLKVHYETYQGTLKPKIG